MSPSQAASDAPPSVPSGGDGGGGGCPVKRDGASVGGGGGGGGGWGSWFGLAPSTSEGTPASAQVDGKESASGGGCPVARDGGGGGAYGRSGRPFPFAVPPPASPEEAARHPQSPRPDQTVPLSTVRVVSSIPRGEEEEAEVETEAPTTAAAAVEGAAAPAPPARGGGCAVPSHQPPRSSRWVYPSEQQFYNAMRRKGWSIDDESTIPHVVRIHNAVNERGWAEIRRWESELHGRDEPRLVRFLGRPGDVSPRAWFNSRVLMYREPFDRHDWYVDRGDGTARRYVIDFYEGNDGGGGGSGGGGGGASDGGSGAVPGGGSARPPAMYLDVRPALDDADAFVDRARMFVKDAFPGLFAAFGGRGDAAATAPSSSGAAGRDAAGSVSK